MCPRISAAVLVAAGAAAAHAPVATRTLRLQLEDGRLEGLLTFHLPAAAAKIYVAAANPAVALVPRALRGLRIEADGAEKQPKVAKAAARKLPDGALEASFLLEIGDADRAITVAVEAEPPLPIEFVTQTGVRLRLVSGPGAPRSGGLSLRPRPGVPCSVAITSAGSPGSRR